MTNALILSMLAFLVDSHGVDYPRVFTVTWWLAVFFNAFAPKKWR